LFTLKNDSDQSFENDLLTYDILYVYKIIQFYRILSKFEIQTLIKINCNYEFLILFNYRKKTCEEPIIVLH